MHLLVYKNPKHSKILEGKRVERGKKERDRIEGKVCVTALRGMDGHWFHIAMMPKTSANSRDSPYMDAVRLHQNIMLH